MFSRNSDYILSLFYWPVKLQVTSPIGRTVSDDQSAFLQHPIHDGFREVMVVKDFNPKENRAMNAMVDRLLGMVAQIQESADRVASPTEEINSAIVQIAKGAT